MEKPKPLLRKEDIVQSTITINVTRKHTTSADITSLKLKVNLQEWIKILFIKTRRGGGIRNP
jgi:hypothetical protein